MTPPAPVDLAEMAREIVNHDIDADWTHDYQTPKWQAKEAQDAAAASILRALSSAHLAGQRVGRGEDERLRVASDRLGKWMSAALDDPGVCAEMKTDIERWFAALVPEPPAPEKSK